jgi:hypothetical protein
MTLQGEGNIEELATRMFFSARRLMEGTCFHCLENDPIPDELELDDGKAVPNNATGVLFVVYTPRYPGMGIAMRKAAAAAGMWMVAIDRNSLMTPAQKASLIFGRVRVIAMSRCRHRLAEVMKVLHVVEADRADELDDWPEDALDLSRIAVD